MTGDLEAEGWRQLFASFQHELGLDHPDPDPDQEPDQ